MMRRTQIVSVTTVLSVPTRVRAAAKIPEIVSDEKLIFESAEVPLIKRHAIASPMDLGLAHQLMSTPLPTRFYNPLQPLANEFLVKGWARHSEIRKHETAARI